jgi:hypothetical protein
LTFILSISCVAAAIIHFCTKSIMVYPIFAIAFLWFALSSFREYRKAKTKIVLLEIVGTSLVTLGATVVFIIEIIR